MSGGVVDIHAHLVGLDREGSGCFVSPAMLGRLSSRFALRLIGARRSDPPRDIDRRYADYLHRHLDGAPGVARVVLLGFDGAYGPDGRLDEARTHMFVPNDAVFAAAARHPKLVAGASVNPRRADALAELERCKARGAVLVKWLPAAQGFDPADPGCDRFYAKLVELRLPLLSHVGTEKAVASADPRFGEPARLRRAIEAGVTVIVPHAGGRKMVGEAADWGAFRSLVLSSPRVFLDESALTMLHRRGRLLRLLEETALHPRVLHGSDFPLPVHPWSFVDRLGIRKARALGKIPSVFERDVAVKRALGAPEEWFTRAGDLLGLDSLAKAPPTTRT